ncbi:MAG: hypothetical protein C4326_15280 [Ignavibacteria bacterium]
MKTNLMINSTILLASLILLGTLWWERAPPDNSHRRQASDPVIREVKPTAARVGEKVKIEGAFGSRNVTVLFNGVPAPILKLEDDEVRVLVPPGASSGPLVVIDSGRRSAPVFFIVKGTSARPKPETAPPHSTRASATMPSPRVGTTAASFSKDIQPIFDRSCTECHGGSAGLFLDEGESYANLVNVPATKGCTSERRVEPGKPAASVLFKRLTGTTCGTQMPKKAPPLPPEEIALIEQWILAGAPNN